MEQLATLVVQSLREIRGRGIGGPFGGYSHSEIETRTKGASGTPSGPGNPSPLPGRVRVLEKRRTPG